MSATPSSTFITPTSSTGAADEPAAYLRREFSVTRQPTRATLRTTAIGLIEPHLNGMVVGDEALAPGWTSYRHRLVVSSHDVTESIVIGRNAVGVVLGQGWALGRLGWDGIRNHYSDRPGAWIQLELEYGDGVVESIANDTDFL